VNLKGGSALVTGAASGLGLASATALVERGVPTVMLDLPTSEGEIRAKELGELAVFAPGDVLDPASVDAALEVAEDLGRVRALVHCAGRGATVRVVDRPGRPGSLEQFDEIVRLNLVGTFNVLRLSAARMVANEPLDDERGVCVLTASVAAWEGQVGQVPYASAKAGVVGMTLVAARDLASRQVRVCTIAPGVFDTPILSRLSDEFKSGLAASVPHPSRLGKPAEFAALAMHLIDNPMINGETVRLDGAIRMAPR
jgi:NAD(P)-dependent dehydrogenase (short-subunit alcohol dehydrogenase family)